MCVFYINKLVYLLVEFHRNALCVTRTYISMNFLIYPVSLTERFSFILRRTRFDNSIFFSAKWWFELLVGWLIRSFIRSLGYATLREWIVFVAKFNKYPTKQNEVFIFAETIHVSFTCGRFIHNHHLPHLVFRANCVSVRSTRSTLFQYGVFVQMFW